MPYCRYCGREITYKRTKNDHWMPCNLLTGEKHFCKEEGGVNSGLSVCPDCGKPVFETNGKIIDYASLSPHKCMKADVTRYTKYKDITAKKEALMSKERSKGAGAMRNTENPKPKKKTEPRGKKGASAARKPAFSRKKTAQTKQKKTSKGEKKK